MYKITYSIHSTPGGGANAILYKIHAISEIEK